MKKNQIHFGDASKPPVGKFGTVGGASYLIHKSICGTCEHDTTTDLSKVTCLLYLRSIISRVRRSARDFGATNPIFTNPNLFDEISKNRKKRKRTIMNEKPCNDDPAVKEVRELAEQDDRAGFSSITEKLDAERDAEKPAVEKCKYCGGTGEICHSSTNYSNCPECKGRGIIEKVSDTPDGY